MDELFNNIDEESKSKLLKELESHRRFYHKNTIILSSAKKEDIICIILTGHIQIIKNDINGNQTIIENLYENNIFGNITSNISNNEYEIITKENSEIIIIDWANIKSLTNSNEACYQFIKNIINIMHTQIEKNNTRIEIITNKTIREKLLAYFKLMSKNRESNIIYLPFNYSDLANYLATNRSALSRELKYLQEEGLIEIKGKKIKLLYYI